MVGNLISRAGNGLLLFLGLAGAIFGGNLLRAGDGGGVALAIGVALLGMGGYGLAFKRCEDCGLVLHGAWTCESCGHSQTHDLD
jgi:hypothetical protein